MQPEETSVCETSRSAMTEPRRGAATATGKKKKKNYSCSFETVRVLWVLSKYIPVNLIFFIFLIIVEREFR